MLLRPGARQSAREAQGGAADYFCGSTSSPISMPGIANGESYFAGSRIQTVLMLVNSRMP